MESAVFLIATAAFIIGVLAIAYEGGGRTPSERARTGLYTFAALAAALAYAVMANGGGFLLSQGGLFKAPRYLLWIAAVPALSVALALSAFPAGRRNIGLTAAVALAVAAAFAALGVSALTAGLAHWMWFVVSLALLGVAAGIVWLPLREYAEDGHPVRRETFVSLAGATTVLVALYPVIFFFGPNGVGLWGDATSTTLFALADVWLMIGTGLLAIWGGRALVGVERSERGEAITAAPRPDLPRPVAPRPARLAAAGAPAPRQPVHATSRDQSGGARPIQAALARASAAVDAVTAGTGDRATGMRFTRQHWALRGNEGVRLRQEWQQARERLVALQNRSAASPFVRSVAASLRAAPFADGIRRLSFDGLGRPPQRLMLGGHAYALAGRTSGPTAPASGQRPLRPGAEPPREIALGEFRYRRVVADTAPPSAAARSRAPGADPSPAGHKPQRPGALARARPEPSAGTHKIRPRRQRQPDQRQTLAWAAISRLTRIDARSIADLPLDRIRPESAVPVAIVAGVLYWVSRPGGTGDKDVKVTPTA